MTKEELNIEKKRETYPRGPAPQEVKDSEYTWNWDEDRIKGLNKLAKENEAWYQHMTGHMGGF